jgi:hypothetical protein
MRCPHLVIDQVYTWKHENHIEYTKKSGYLSGVSCSNDNNVHIYIAFRSVNHSYELMD